MIETNRRFFHYFQKKMAKDLVVSKKSSTFALAYQKWQQTTLQGVLTERLGNGLQNRVERFDSARHLLTTSVHWSWFVNFLDLVS